MIGDGLLPEVFAAQILFWILLPFVLFAPIRWSVVAWLIMSNLDATGPGVSALTSAGWMNAVKSLVLPLFLIWRLRDVESKIYRLPTAQLWIALTGYAALATLWAPFPLAAAKLVGNMAGIFIAVLVIEKAARKGILTSGALLVLLSASLILAVFQTYYFGGASYGFDGFDQPTRLSSFIGAQQFAGFLVVFLTLLLWRRDVNTWIRFTAGTAVLLALALNGSRVWFFGAALVTLAYVFFSFRRATLLGVLAILWMFPAFLLTQSFSPNGSDDVDESSNRIIATLRALATGVDSSNRVGLRDLTFRTAIYNGVLDDLGASSPVELVFGHGTSSGAESVMRVFPNSYNTDLLDPNRIVHNEWLRAAYEWGAIGFVLLAGVFITLLGGLMVMRRSGPIKPRASAALSFVGAFLLAFSGENVLAGAGNAVTMSLALILGLLWAPLNLRKEQVS